MTTASHLLLIGQRVKQARDAKKLTQQELAARYNRARQVGEYPYARNTLTNFLLSRIEKFGPEGKDNRHKRQTVELLADVLGVGVETISIPDTINTDPLSLDSSTEESIEVLPAPALADLPGVDLPFTTIPAHGSFTEMLSPEVDYGLEETIRYVLPPRPLEEYAMNKSRVFTVAGDSMAPEISSGERIIADLLPESRWELLSNNIIVIQYDQTLTVKWVRENELLTRRVLTLYPERADLSPLTVRRELIRHIYLVRESFERKRWA